MIRPLTNTTQSTGAVNTCLIAAPTREHPPVIVPDDSQPLLLDVPVCKVMEGLLVYTVGVPQACA